MKITMHTRNNPITFSKVALGSMNCYRLIFAMFIMCYLTSCSSHSVQTDYPQDWPPIDISIGNNKTIFNDTFNCYGEWESKVGIKQNIYYSRALNLGCILVPDNCPKPDMIATKCQLVSLETLSNGNIKVTTYIDKIVLRENILISGKDFTIVDDWIIQKDPLSFKRGRPVSRSVSDKIKYKYRFDSAGNLVVKADVKTVGHWNFLYKYTSWNVWLRFSRN